MFRKRKERKAKERELLEKRMKMEEDLKIKRNLTQLKRQRNKINKMKDEYLIKARDAHKNGNQKEYSLIKTTLKNFIKQERHLSVMIALSESTIQMGEMNLNLKSFMEASELLTKHSNNLITTEEIIKMQESYNNLIVNNNEQYSSMEDLLDNMSSSFESIDYDSDDLDDLEIEKLIFNEVLNQEEEIDHDMEARIKEIKKELNR